MLSFLCGVTYYISHTTEMDGSTALRLFEFGDMSLCGSV